MDSVTNLRTFLTVVQCAGFSEAARMMNVVPSVVAKRIAQLEEAFGVRLFSRTTRSVVLTDAGQRLMARARVLVADFDDMAQSMRRDESRLEGQLRLMLPTTLTLLYLGDVIARFLSSNERVSLDISLADRSINPMEQAFDIVVSGRAAHYDGVTQLPLAPIHYMLCASPEYLARAHPLTHPDELSRHRCLVFKPAGKMWSFVSAHGQMQVDVSPVMQTDDTHSLLLAALQGVGIAVLPGYLADPALMRGELTALLPGFPCAPAWFKAYVPKRLEREVLVRHLCTHIQQALEELPNVNIVSLGTLPRSGGLGQQRSN